MSTNPVVPPRICGSTASALGHRIGPVALRRGKLSLAIASTLLLGLQPTAQAQSFPASVELSSLNGSNDFVLNGEAAGDFAGAVSAAGDINGDGIDDLIVGASGADPTVAGSGRSYVCLAPAAACPRQLNCPASTAAMALC